MKYVTKAGIISSRANAAMMFGASTFAALSQFENKATEYPRFRVNLSLAHRLHDSSQFRRRRGELMLRLDDLIRDLRYGLRLARNAKLVSIAVVLTLAVGIGINSGIFTLINGMVLRPRTNDSPSTFARLYAQYWSRGNPRDAGGQFSVADYRAIQSDSQSLQELAAWRAEHLIVGQDSTSTFAIEVSCNFFSVYGLTQPKLGRLFRADECAPKTEALVVILSEEEWRDRFAADANIVGSKILLNREPFTVVGIVPADFAGRLRGPGVWVPYTLQHRLSGNDDIFRADKTPALWLEGRLRSGKTRDQLAAEANVIVSRVPLADPNLKQRVLVTSGALIEDPGIREKSFWILLIIFTGALLLLLVSCASGAVLLLSRAAARQQEIAVRLSLGAAPRRVVRQLLCENLLLAAAAGVLGTLIALRVPHVFQLLLPQMPHYRFTLDLHIFSYVSMATLVTAIVSGMVPAAECMRQDVWTALKGHGPTMRAGRIRWNAADLLVAVQVSLCVVLMVVSAMFSRAVLLILNMEPGFETRHVLTIPFRLSPDRYGSAQVEAFYQNLQEQLADLPMVDAVAISSITPLASDFGQANSGPGFRSPGQTSEQSHGAMVRIVSQGYFRAVDIPILHGEEFENTSSADNEVIVSQSFAAAFWPAQDPVGQVVISPEGKRLRVIGVARDTRTAYTEEPDDPCIYMLRRTPLRGDLVIVRFRGDAAPVSAAVKRVVRDLDTETLALPSTLRADIASTAEQLWTLGEMLLFVAFVAAVLAIVGIYGVVGYSVTRRTREYGIRAALGATPHELMRLVFASGIQPVLAGTAVGVVFAAMFSLGLVASLRNAPIPLRITNPIPYAVVCATLIASAMAAMLRHARRAAAIEPLLALREE